MEDLVRFLHYTLIQQFADANKLKVSFPYNDPVDEQSNVDSNGDYIFSDMADEDMFLRPQIVSLRPDEKGLRHGLASYSWIVQISVYTKNGKGEMAGAQMADKIRSEFKFGRREVTDGGEYTTTQTTQPAANSHNEVGGWIALPITWKIVVIS